MFANYRAAFRAPGSAAFCTAGALMRLPIAIYPLGLILLISTRTHHYGFAGILSAAYVLGSAPGNLVGGRLVDRYGQRRILMPMTALHGLSVVVLIYLAQTNRPGWTMLAPAVMAGFTYLPVGSLVRARWSYVLVDPTELAGAYSLESTFDEVIFVVGPLIATIVATQIDPVLVMVLAGVLVASGAVLLARLRDTAPPPHPIGSPARRVALRYQGMTLVVLFSVAMGAMFASAEVTMVAFCGQHGHQSLSGLVLAAFAVSSAISGLFYGARTWTWGLLDRFRAQALVLAVLSPLFLAATNVPQLTVCAFVVGLGVAPALIAAFALISRIVPGASLTEGLSWLTTGLSLGYGAATAAVGRIADVEGARTAFSVTVVAAICMGLLALRIHVVLRANHGDEPAGAVPA